jgi:hypothetical protein
VDGAGDRLYEEPAQPARNRLNAPHRSGASDDVGLDSLVISDGSRTWEQSALDYAWKRTLSGLPTNRTYTLTVRARHAAGNLSAPSNAVSVLNRGPAALHARRLRSKRQGRLGCLERQLWHDRRLQRFLRRLEPLSGNEWRDERARADVRPDVRRSASPPRGATRSR